MALVIAGMALIISIVAIYYVSKAYDLLMSVVSILVAAEIIEVKYIDEGEDD